MTVLLPPSASLGPDPLAEPHIRLRKLQRVVRVAGWAALGAALAVAAAEAYLLVEPMALLSLDALPRVLSPETVSASHLALAWLVQLVPATLFILAMLTAWRLFRLWAEAQVFHARAPDLLAQLGQLSVASALGAVLARPLMTVILTAEMPPGQRLISIGISSADIAVVVFGLVFFALAMVMREAILIEQDSRGFV